MNLFLTKYYSLVHRHCSVFVVTLLFTLILVIGCKSKPSQQDEVKVESESILTKIKIKDLNDQDIEMSQYKGKTLFINFWATWCKPCIKEMPSIGRAKNILKDNDIEFLIASNESVEQIQNFTAKQNPDLHYVQLQNLEELNIPALPTTFIINAEGELIFSETGYREWDDAANIDLLTKIINKE